MSEPVGGPTILNDRNGEGPQPYLKDVRVRQAINHALDRKLMSQALFGNSAEPTAQLQARGFVGYDAKLDERYPMTPPKQRNYSRLRAIRTVTKLTVAYVNNSMSQFLRTGGRPQLRRVGITVKGMEAQHFGVLRSMADNRHLGHRPQLELGIPNLAKFQVLDSNGGLITSPTRTTLIKRWRSLKPAGG